MKKLLFLTILFFGVLSLQAQERTFWHQVNRFLTKPAVVDTTRIYQPKACFSLGLFTTGQKAGFDVDVNFGFNMPDVGLVTGTSSYRLSEGLCKKIGLEVGYGNVGFGYGLEVGPRSAAKKSSFAFNIVGKSWGVRLNYFKITNQFVSALSMWNEDTEIYPYHEFVSDEMAALRSFTLDGYYVFNNKRFAYPAAYKMGLVQRRTAGSWMLTARYMQGDLYNSPEGAVDSYNLLDCFATMQASLGGGYSVNFVPWHRDPVGPRDEGLRNLTVNLTAMPVVTLFNRLKTTSYVYDDASQLVEKTSKLMCYPVPNYIGSAAVSLTMGRVYFSTQFTYNRFYFRSRDAINNSQLEIPDNLTDLDYRGIFHDWMLKGLVVYRF
ncbi:MAG: DUF4421 family protein [Bacteroidales bacterium]|nr:DUF4421 family protein [Bacteroidales bacterium]